MQDREGAEIAVKRDISKKNCKAYTTNHDMPKGNQASTFDGSHGNLAEEGNFYSRR